MKLPKIALMNLSYVEIPPFAGVAVRFDIISTKIIVIICLFIFIEKIFLEYLRFNHTGI